MTPPVVYGFAVEPRSPPGAAACSSSPARRPSVGLLTSALSGALSSKGSAELLRTSSASWASDDDQDQDACSSDELGCSPCSASEGHSGLIARLRSPQSTPVAIPDKCCTRNTAWLEQRARYVKAVVAARLELEREQEWGSR